MQAWTRSTQSNWQTFWHGGVLRSLLLTKCTTQDGKNELPITQGVISLLPSAEKVIRRCTSSKSLASLGTPRYLTPRDLGKNIQQDQTATLSVFLVKVLQTTVPLVCSTWSDPGA